MVFFKWKVWPSSCIPVNMKVLRGVVFSKSNEESLAPPLTRSLAKHIHIYIYMNGVIGRLEIKGGFKTNLHQLNSFCRSAILFGRNQVYHHALRIKKNRGHSDLWSSRSSLQSKISLDCPQIYLGFLYGNVDWLALEIVENAGEN